MSVMPTTDPTNSPARFRVSRYQPGVTWAPNTHSYHRTMAAARRAADQFLKAQGRYHVVHRKLATEGRYAVVAERKHARGGQVYYDTIARWKGAVPAEVAS